MVGMIAKHIKGTIRKTLEIKDFITKCEYEQLTREVEGLVEAGILSPRGKKNGLNPPLYHSYWIHRASDDDALSEIRAFTARFSNTFYLKNTKQYREDKNFIDLVFDFYKNKGHLLTDPASINERAYQIVGDEKWLSDTDKNGVKILGRLGISVKDLNVFPTPEPFAYFQYKDIIENVLISENKDAFHDIRKVAAGRLSSFMGIRLDLLVWGQGNSIQKSFAFLEELKVAANPVIYYWGDLDYAGLSIFSRLCANYPDYKIVPLIPVYQHMMNVTPHPPKQTTKVLERNIELFVKHFDEHDKERILSILESLHRIPQESIPYQEIGRLMI